MCRIKISKKIELDNKIFHIELRGRLCSTATTAHIHTQYTQVNETLSTNIFVHTSMNNANKLAKN